jgi:hypothetical protein
VKSPIKFDRQAIAGFFFIWLVFLAIDATSNSWASLSFWQIIGKIVLLLIMLALLLFVPFVVVGSTILNRRVNSPADPDNLVIGQRYWLNGETWAKYLGQDRDTGEYRFSIYGVNKEDNPEDSTDLKPGHIRNYISTVQEV